MISRSYNVKSTQKPLLSIVIPAHNEAMRLPATLTNIATFLKSQSFTSDILVVENASSDGTYELALSMQATIQNLEVIQESVKGKGQAVKRGILAARGEYRLICDADLSMPATEIPKFIPPLLTGCDIAIASREAKGAKRLQRTALPTPDW